MRRLYHICADMLRDASKLLRYDIRFTDSIKQLCLSVIDVAHDSDDRRPMLEFLRLVSCFLNDGLVIETHNFHLAPVLGRENGCSIGVDLLIYRRHNSKRHKFADQVRRFQVHFFCELRDADILHDINRFRYRSELGFCLFLHLNLLL